MENSYRMVNLRLILILAAFTITAASSHAQGFDEKPGRLAVYGMVSPTFVDGPPEGTATESRFLTAGTVGLTFHLNHGDALAISLDIRGSSRPGTPGFDTALGGIRVASNRHHRLIPYFQVSAGYLSTRSVATTYVYSGSTLTTSAPTNVQTNSGVVEGLVGFDYRIARKVDFRILEAGVGVAFDRSFNPFYAAAIAISPTSALFLTTDIVVPISTGIVVHF